MNPILINKKSGRRISGILWGFFQKKCNNGVLFSSLFFLSGFQEMLYMGCIIEMKETRRACGSCDFSFHWGHGLFSCSPPCRNFLYRFPGLGPNGERSGDFSGEASTLQNHLVTDCRLLSQSTVLLSVSPSLFHLTPFSPATRLSQPSQSGLYPSLHRPIFSSCMFFLRRPHSLSPPAMILVRPASTFVSDQNIALEDIKYLRIS